MNQRFEPLQFRRFAKHTLGQRGAIHAGGPGRARELRLDLGDQGAVGALQLVNGRIRVEHRYAFLSEHLRDRRLAHADRAGETEEDHDISLSRRAGVSAGSGETLKKWVKAIDAW